MSHGWVDYRAVKANVSMEMALATYGIHLHRLDRDYLRGRCPLPTHESKTSLQSFIVNIEKNAWACHSESCVAQRAGRIGGNVLDFIALMERCSVRDAAVRLHEWFALSAGQSLSAQAFARHTAEEHSSPVAGETNKPLPFQLSSLDQAHPYLQGRGVTPDTARYFGIGHHRGKGLMEGRVVIPIHDEHGFLVAYAGRSIDGAEPKYRFPSRFRKSIVLFNLHRAVGCGDSVIVVEGFFDAVNLHQSGLPCVVALMGCSLSQRQEALLLEHFREVVLLLDGDTTGRRAAAAIAQRLLSNVSTRLVEIPDGTQPDMLSADQIRCLCIPGYF
ncbi:MAG: toprim domain-containing protein [Candidatus Solibacter sp.]